jgi:hypothetical protein
MSVGSVRPIDKAICLRVMPLRMSLLMASMSPMVTDRFNKRNVPLLAKLKPLVTISTYLNPCNGTMLV